MASNLHAMSDDDRDFLRKNRGIIIDNLEVDSVLPIMQVWDENTREDIRSKRTRRAKIEKLLDMLPRRGAEAFEDFISAIYKVQKWLAEHLAEKKGVDLKDLLPADESTCGMDRVHREVLRVHLPKLLPILDVEKMLKSLLEKKTICQDIANKISDEQDRNIQVEKLCNVLTRSGSNAFEDFLNALQFNQPTFAHEFKKLIQESHPAALQNINTSLEKSQKTATTNVDVEANAEGNLQYTHSTPCSVLPQIMWKPVQECLDRPDEFTGEELWKRLYNALKLPEGKENVIEAKDGSPTEHVIKIWIDRRGRKAILEKFLQALVQCDQGGLAHRLEQDLHVDVPCGPVERDVVDAVAGMANMNFEEKKKSKAIRLVKNLPHNLRDQLIQRLDGLNEGILSTAATEILAERCYVRNAADFLNKIGEHKMRILFRELRKADQCNALVTWMRNNLPPGSTGPLKCDDQTRCGDMKYGYRSEITRILTADDLWKKLASHPHIELDNVQIKLIEKQSASKDPSECVLSHWEVGSRSTVGTMYDLLVDCEFDQIADLL